jgi:lipopolysaccharide export system permease protein
MLALLLTSVVWLVQILPLLDLVINRGQSALTFAYLVMLVLPTLFIIILPFSFLFGSLFALQRLSGDSELVVMASAGYSPRQLAGPVLTAAAVVMGLTWLCSLYLAPAGQRTLNAKKLDINADIGAALLSEGQFIQQGGLTVFIRSLDPDGTISGIMAHDGRDRSRPLTYIADRGQIVQTPAGARLMLYDATVQAGRGRQLTMIRFDRYGVNLDEFVNQARNTLRRPGDRFLPELLWPPEAGQLPARTLQTFAAEAHNRLSQPLYCIAFGLIALAAVARGRRHRGSIALRMALGAMAALGLYLGGYGIAGAAQSEPMLLPAFYLIPLIGAGLAILVLAGYSPRAILARRRAVAA